jgi:hypothetical protein
MTQLRNFLRLFSLFSMALALAASLLIPANAARADDGDPDDGIDDEDEKTSQRINRAVFGIAYEDLDADGQRDPGEPSMGFAFFKLTAGGTWYTCGQVANDGTFGVVVKKHRKKKYFLMPIAAPGYRTTTPWIKVSPSLNGQPDKFKQWEMGFVKDPDAKLDACDQYNPPRTEADKAKKKKSS